MNAGASISTPAHTFFGLSGSYSMRVECTVHSGMLKSNDHARQVGITVFAGEETRNNLWMYCSTDN